jgi:preprotein translocase subunit YajC
MGIIAFAEETAATGANAAVPGGGSSAIMSILMMVLVIVLLYFIMIRPQKKREKQIKEMVNAAKVGDSVVTIGGIAGKIVKIKDQYVYIETGVVGDAEKKGYLKMERDAIKSVESKQSN